MFEREKAKLSELEWDEDEHTPLIGTTTSLGSRSSTSAASFFATRLTGVWKRHGVGSGRKTVRLEDSVAEVPEHAAVAVMPILDIGEAPRNEADDQRSTQRQLLRPDVLRPDVLRPDVLRPDELPPDELPRAPNGASNHGHVQLGEVGLPLRYGLPARPLQQRRDGWDAITAARRLQEITHERTVLAAFVSLGVLLVVAIFALVFR